MGAAIAWQAALRGLSVAAFDAFEPPHTLGSTHGHSRIIREAYFEHPQYVPLVQRAYALWAELEASAGTRLFQACGGLMVGRPGSVLVDGTLRAAAEHALPVQTWDAGGGAGARAGSGARRRHGRGVRAAGRRAGAGARGGRDAGPGATGWRALFTVTSPCARWTPTRRSRRGAAPTAAHVRARRLVLAAGPWLPSLLGELRAAAHRRARRAVLVSHSRRRAVHAGARSRFFCWRRPTAACCTGCPTRDMASSWPSITAAPSTTATPWTGTCLDAERAAFHAFASRWVRDLPAGPGRGGRLPLHQHARRRLRPRLASRGPRCLRLQRLLGARIQVRAGHRRGRGLGRRHGHVAARSGAVPPGTSRLTERQGRTDPRGRLSRSV